VAIEALVEIDGAVKRATKASTGSLKRPPQDWLVLSVLMDSLVICLKEA
jgi:hypothetical protein